MFVFVFSQFRTLSQAPGAGNGIAPMAMQPVTGAKAQVSSRRCDQSISIERTNTDIFAFVCFFRAISSPSPRA